MDGGGIQDALAPRFAGGAQDLNEQTSLNEESSFPIARQACCKLTKFIRFVFSRKMFLEIV
jgi:hypothetical protein